MEKYITLNSENIEKEHICCAISDKKCVNGYNNKKRWLEQEFKHEYIFRRLDAKAKVFMEYVAAEKAWVPIDAVNYMMILCFWVSGQYKGHGHAKALLQQAIDDAKQQKKFGLVTIVGFKKFHFMSDTKWLLRQGFKTIETLPNGFSLLALQFDEHTPIPTFKTCVREDNRQGNHGLVVYYSDRCPYTDYYVTKQLPQLALAHDIPLEMIKFESCEEAQNSPTPATIFSAYWNGRFLTTDISLCTPSKFKKLLKIE